jgi:hypothetical protein
VLEGSTGEDGAKERDEAMIISKKVSSLESLKGQRE